MGRPRRRRSSLHDEQGSAVVEFALVSVIALSVTLAVLQYALFLYERNVLMGSLSEGARVAATQGRTAADGERRAATLVRQAVGGRVAGALTIAGAAAGDRVVLTATGQLPSFVPGFPDLPVRMTASMHKEEQLVPTTEVPR
jgi:Flp pilus assembly protein TadG